MCLISSWFYVSQTGTDVSVTSWEWLSPWRVNTSTELKSLCTGRLFLSALRPTDAECLSNSRWGHLGLPAVRYRVKKWSWLHVLKNQMRRMKLLKHTVRSCWWKTFLKKISAVSAEVAWLLSGMHGRTNDMLSSFGFRSSTFLSGRNVCSLGQTLPLVNE